MTENTQKLMTFGKQLRTFENGYVDLLIQRKWSLIKPIKCHIKGIGKKKKNTDCSFCWRITHWASPHPQ